MMEREPLVLTPSRRQLTATEQRLIRGKISNLAARGRRASRRSVPITAVGVAGLWLWTILASDAPWTVVTGFWLVVGAVIGLWVRRDLQRDAGTFGSMAQGLASALRRNAADVYDVRAHSYVELEEIEDEGACYVFELEDNRLLVITGQEFYESARFPSLDFALVNVLDEHGRVVDMLIDKRGVKTKPARTISAAVKRTLEVPEHLEIRLGRIDDVERVLRPS